MESHCCDNFLYLWQFFLIHRSFLLVENLKKDRRRLSTLGTESQNNELFCLICSHNIAFQSDYTTSKFFHLSFRLALLFVRQVFIYKFWNKFYFFLEWKNFTCLHEFVIILIKDLINISFYSLCIFSHILDQFPPPLPETSCPQFAQVQVLGIMKSLSRILSPFLTKSSFLSIRKPDSLQPSQFLMQPPILFRYLPSAKQNLLHPLYFHHINFLLFILWVHPQKIKSSQLRWWEF